MERRLITGAPVVFADGQPAGWVGLTADESFELRREAGAPVRLGLYAIVRLDKGQVVLGCLEERLLLFAVEP